MPRSYPTRPATANVIAAPIVGEPEVARAIAEVSDAVREVQRDPIVPRSGALGELFYRGTGGLLTALGPNSGPAGQLTQVDGVPAWRFMDHIIRPPTATYDSAAGTRTLTSGNCSSVYMGRAPRSLSDETVTVCIRVTTAYVAGTGGTPWAELAIATGAVVPGGNASLTAQVYADISLLITSTGALYLPIQHVTIDAGTDWWLLIGCQVGSSGGTAAVIRSTGLGDELQLGVQGERASYRPSTNINRVRVFTTDLNTIAAPWTAMIIA